MPSLLDPMQKQSHHVEQHFLWMWVVDVLWALALHLQAQTWTSSASLGQALDPQGCAAMVALVTVAAMAALLLLELVLEMAA